MLHPEWIHTLETERQTGQQLRWLALGVLSLAIAIGQADMTIVNVALQSIAQDLDATTSDLQWVMDAYTVVLAGFVLAGGGLADRFGRKGTFMAGLALFGSASVAGTFAVDPWQLIAARAVMGLGAALFFPPSLSLLAVIFPPEERARAVTIWTIIGGAATAFGPIIGGVLVDNFWWGSALLVNVPVTVIGLVGAALLLPRSSRPGAPALDRGGAVLSVVGLGSLVFGIIEGPSRGWSSPLIVAALVFGISIIVVFVVWEVRQEEPMVDVTVALIDRVAGGGAVIVTSLIALSATLFLVPLYLQSVRGVSAMEVGFLLLPFGLVFTAVAVARGVVVDRLGMRGTLVAGMLFGAAGLASLVFIDTGVGLAVVVAGTCAFGAGTAVCVPTATTEVMNALPTEKAGDGSAVNQITRQVGATLGVAITGTILASIYASDLMPAVGRLSPTRASVAEASIDGAQKVAAGLTSGSQALLDAADAAFLSGFRFAILVAAAVTIVGALVAAIMLPGDADRSAHRV